MQQVPVPPELVPEGGQLTPAGFAYMDAFELPILNAQPDDGESLPRVAIVRANHLFEASKDDVQALARNGWMFWVRHAQVTGGVYLAIEPMVPILRANLPLNSDLPDQPLGGSP
jgi:hypothetical protein